jgi:hypothetical protein
LEEPVIDRDALLSRVQKHYRLYGLRLRFLPIGNDVRSAAYRLDAAGRGGFFLKRRQGSFNRASLEVPNALQLNGEAHVIAPVPTFGGRLSIPFANSRVALYPFVDASVQVVVAEQGIAFPRFRGSSIVEHQRRNESLWLTSTRLESASLETGRTSSAAQYHFRCK